jgi:hypothetical protein
MDNIIGIIKDTIFDNENKFDVGCKRMAIGLI